MKGLRNEPSSHSSLSSGDHSPLPQSSVLSPQSFIRRSIRLVILFVLLALLLVALWQRWYLAYLAQAAVGQVRLLARARPIEQVLQDGTLSPADQAKLRLVLAAKTFAENDLGLKPSRNYAAFADIGPGPVSYVLTACPADRLEYHRWWFPVVGWVPYLGFFHREGVLAEERKMALRGYDTAVREVPAYSTLGWFPDPVTSPMLQYPDQALVATIIHELTHGTLYLSGQGDFNEGLATLVGMQGAIAFYCRSPGPSCDASRRNWSDTVLFAGFMDRLYRRLDAILRRPVARAIKLQEKHRLLTAIPAELAAWRKEQGVQSFRWFGTGTLNNAEILSLYLYYRHLPLFEKAFQRQGSGVKEFLAAVRGAVTGSPDPLAALRDLTRQR